MTGSEPASWSKSASRVTRVARAELAAAIRYVLRVARSDARGRVWILDPFGESVTEELDEGAGLVVTDQATQLRVRKRLLELVRQSIRDNELKLPSSHLPS